MKTKEVSFERRRPAVGDRCSSGAGSTEVRHLVAIFQDLYTNGSAGRTILMRYKREEASAILVSFLGLPSVREWADSLLQILESEGRIEEIDGIGCRPVVVRATTEEALDWIGGHLRSRASTFPDCKGTIGWPDYSLAEALIEETRAQLG